MQTVDLKNACDYLWLAKGDDAFAAMLSAINAAQRSIRLETYTFTDCALGRRFLEALIHARKRKIEVKVLLDGFGSWELPESFWSPLVRMGGQFRWFNPLSFARFGLRDHRKLLVCDASTAFVGGFNIAAEYEGDGVNRGWFDAGLRVGPQLAAELAKSFDAMFQGARMRHGLPARLRRPIFNPRVTTECGELLQSGPGLARNTIRHSLQQDLKVASRIQIAAAYFLPPWRLRRVLERAARRGSQVQLLLPGVSDVLASQLASQRLYAALLRAGVEIFEYQPQVMHAKLSIIDHTVYIGSANLDVRSLRINYELVVRLTSAWVAQQARNLFAEALKHSRRIDLETWNNSRSLWTRLRERWAYFLLARVDLYLARRQWRQIW
jgi:cardiolipin synthase A/B